jgi:hypothetical protein
LTGSLPATPVLQDGVKGSYMKMFIFLTGKPRPSGRRSFTFHASLHQERFAKWSKRDSFGSHKSLAAVWITEHYYENHCKGVGGIISQIGEESYEKG